MESYNGFRLSVVERITQLDWRLFPLESNILPPLDEIEFSVNVKSVYIVTRAVACLFISVDRRIRSVFCTLIILK